jgi:hypothetical protein
MKLHEKDFSKAIIIMKKCWGSPNLNFWATTTVSKARRHDGSYNHVPPILVEYFVIEGSFLFTFECYQIYILCCLQDYWWDYGPPSLGFTYAWCAILLF